jgi:cytochrome oxidase Cu insertion factor (SCO1/SenC/PrrC family)
LKKSFLFAFFLLVCVCAFSQDPVKPSTAKASADKPGYLQFPTVPPFTLMKTDSSSLTRDDLARNKKLLFMYFSPECEHCLHQTDSLLANLNKLKDVEILMATYQPMNELADFSRKYKMDNYSNIKLGRDTKFFFAPFYKMKNLPFIALYDKKGKLLTTFEGTTPVNKLIAAFKK